MLFFVNNIVFQNSLKRINPFLVKSNEREKKIEPTIPIKDQKSLDKFSLKKKTQKNRVCVAVFGPGGGFLGVGTSELVVIGIVAWLVLGPKRLYQLARDIGKISGEIKNVAKEARQTFQQAIDVESGESGSLSSAKNSETFSSEEEITKFRINDLDNLVNNEIKTLEKKKKE